MISSALSWWILSLVLLIGYGTAVRLEQIRGKRFGISNVRTHGDQIVLRVAKMWRQFLRSFLQLRWHYGLHYSYRFVLLSLQRIYHRIESRFEANRQRAKRLRKEVKEANISRHLHVVAKHKADTALTAAQKRKLKKKSLEQKW